MNVRVLGTKSTRQYISHSFAVPSALLAIHNTCTVARSQHSTYVTLQISITLEDSVEYDILEEPESPGVRGKRSACIPANDKAVLTVRVTPKVIADVNLTVSATVDPTDFPACGEGANSPQRR